MAAGRNQRLLVTRTRLEGTHALPLPHHPYQATFCPPQAHDAAISKVSWAHPEFGTILATASFDRTVKVWEQISSPDLDGTQLNGAGPAASSSSTRWVERAMLVDAKGTVRAVEFAPQHCGLKLVRLYSPVSLFLLFLSTRYSKPACVALTLKQHWYLSERARAVCFVYASYVAEPDVGETQVGRASTMRNH